MSDVEDLVERFREKAEHLGNQCAHGEAEGWYQASRELEAVLNGESPESVHELPEDIPSGDVGEILSEQEK